jgi:hypothetical protein
MSDCLRVAERLDGFNSRTKQYELVSEPSILRCDVLVNSELATQRERNRSDETKFHEIHGRSEFFTSASSLAKPVMRQVSSRFGSAGGSASR